jgi:hypothetical protein
MAGETLLVSMTNIMGVVAIVASAGCDPGAALPRGTTTGEDSLRDRVAIDVTAIIEGMMAAHGMRLVSDP